MATPIKGPTKKELRIINKGNSKFRAKERKDQLNISVFALVTFIFLFFMAVAALGNKDTNKFEVCAAVIVLFIAIFIIAIKLIRDFGMPKEKKRKVIKK